MNQCVAITDNHQLMHRWDAEVPGITWQRLMDNKNKELDRLNGVYRKLLDGAGVEYIEGRGRIVDAHTVEVNGKTYTVSTSERQQQESMQVIASARQLQGAHSGGLVHNSGSSVKAMLNSRWGASDPLCACRMHTKKRSLQERLC